MRRGTPTAWTLVGLAVFVSWCVGPGLLLPWLAGVGVSPANGAHGAGWLSGLVAWLGSTGGLVVLGEGLATLALVAGTAAFVRWARQASDRLVAYAHAAAALGLESQHVLGPWSAARDGLTLHLDAQEGTLHLTGLPLELTLEPGPGGNTGDPIFDHEVHAQPGGFGPRERATLLSAVRRVL